MAISARGCHAGGSGGGLPGLVVASYGHAWPWPAQAVGSSSGADAEQQDGTGSWRQAAIAVSSGAPATDGGGGAAWPSQDGEVEKLERLEEGATAAMSSRSW